ncbi:MAG: hypothetical protein AB1757_14790 [Acidobacteriota bacterium]
MTDSKEGWKTASLILFLKRFARRYGTQSPVRLIKLLDTHLQSELAQGVATRHSEPIGAMDTQTQPSVTTVQPEAAATADGIINEVIKGSNAKDPMPTFLMTALLDNWLIEWGRSR